MRKYVLVIGLIAVALLVAGCSGSLLTRITLRIGITIVGNYVDPQEVSLWVNETLVTLATDGTATIRLPRGRISVRAIVPGYSVYNISLDLRKDYSLSIVLEPQGT